MSTSVGSEGADPNLTPLLDLVLQLIMFFMITVNFVRVDQFDPSIALPIATHAVALENTTEEFIFLNLDSSGKLVGNLSSLVLDTPEKVKRHLQSEKESLDRVSRSKGRPGDPKVVVILRGDKNCTYRDIWTVLDSCQKASFKHWQLRVKTAA